MHFPKTLSFGVSLFALMAQTSVAFAPLSTTVHSATSQVLKHPATTTAWSHDTPSSFKTSSTTALSAGPDPDLIVGFGTIAAACTPYFLGVIFKDFFNDSFFIPTYEDDEAGRIAEIGWKVRYATLGLALTTLTFLEVYLFPENDPARILRDSYVLWAIFYTDATLKIRREAEADPPVFSGNRLGVQAWHLTVVAILWADVSESVTGNAITNFIKEVFT
jgi:hypothetical protein